MGRHVVLGLVLIAAGFAAAAAIAVPPFLDVKERIEGFPQTRLSEGAVELERREYDVYLDLPAGTGDAGWTLSVRDPQGRAVPLRPAGGTMTYEWSGREGSRIGTVRVTAAGRHAVRGTGPAGADVVFADAVVRDMGLAVVIALAVLFGLGAAGLVLIVLGIARRRPREPKRWP